MILWWFNNAQPYIECLDLPLSTKTITRYRTDFDAMNYLRIKFRIST